MAASHATSAWLPIQDRKKNAVPHVPAKLPTVESAIIRPVCRPKYSRSDTANRNKAGSTPLNPKAGGPRSSAAATQGPQRGSSTTPATLKSTSWPSHAIRKVQAPENSSRPANTCAQGYRSETQPPKAYPLLMAARITPINAPQTNSEFPKTGAKLRLPKISSAITTAPVVGAVIRRNH